MDKEKRDFIIKKGVLGWGIPVALIWSFLRAFSKSDKIFAYGQFSLEKFLKHFVIAIILFPIGGYFFGLWVWNSRQKQRKK